MRKFIVALPLLFVSVTVAQDKTQQPDPKSSQPKLEREVPFDGNVEFPEIDGWELSRRTVYPQKELGYSVNYDSDAGGRVTVYVFNGGRKTIPNELKGPIADELKRAQGEIRAVADMGLYTDVKEHRIKSPVVIGTGPDSVSMLFAKYTLTANGNRLDSEIYVFPYQNYMVKIRSTRPAAVDGKNAAFDRLLVELARLFSKTSLLSVPKVLS